MLIATKDADGQRTRHEFSEAYAGRYEVSPECTDGGVHEYLNILIAIDRKAGTLTFRVPSLFKKLKALWNPLVIGPRKRADSVTKKC